uniref:LRRNT domain-containing protein n=1 Tax=Mola mola TaxID=94237 RepID=A0A3Q3XDC2_MOLML
MGKELGLILLLVLLHFHNANTDSKVFCPYKCQCFTSVQVLCSDGGLLYLPRNLSREVKDFILISSDLQYLFAHTLGDSPQLNRLIFLNNSLRNIHAQAFEHLAELRELEISGNPMLEHLFLGTFARLGNLSKLGLNFNKIKTVLPGIFEGLTQLKTLQMKGNIISDLPTSLFINLRNLRVLDLSQNKIRGVAGEAFSGLLTELHLEWNKISELDDHVFFGLTKLKVLKLRGNLLTTFSDEVFGFEASSLEELNLKGNRLRELSSLGRLTSLNGITLSSNQLSNLPEDIFRNVTALEYLDLSENQLTSVKIMVHFPYCYPFITQILYIVPSCLNK